jgi:hypothetical protein
MSTSVKKICAHFWRSRAKNPAFRFNLFAARRQKGFPLQSFAPHGLTFGLILLTVGKILPKPYDF